MDATGGSDFHSADLEQQRQQRRARSATAPPRIVRGRVVCKPQPQLQSHLGHCQLSLSRLLKDEQQRLPKECTAKILTCTAATEPPPAPAEAPPPPAPLPTHTATSGDSAVIWLQGEHQQLEGLLKELTAGILICTGQRRLAVLEHPQHTPTHLAEGALAHGLRARQQQQRHAVHREQREPLRRGRRRCCSAAASVASSCFSSVCCACARVRVRANVRARRERQRLRRARPLALAAQGGQQAAAQCGRVLFNAG